MTPIQAAKPCFEKASYRPGAGRVQAGNDFAWERPMKNYKGLLLVLLVGVPFRAAWGQVHSELA